jgi:hypothetical protein
VEGTLHGFLTARTGDGRMLASGDLTQTVHGDRLTLRLVFHFVDGSLDDETTVYTQHGSFRLVSDRHIQRGPFFPHPLTTGIDVRSGTVTVRTVDKDGKEQVDSRHMKLPPDLVNGLIYVLVKDLPPGAATTTLPMIVFAPKPRMVKVVFTPRGEDQFSIAGMSPKAEHFDLKVDLGGIAGVVAPLIGKQPPDIQVWVVGGDAPVIVRGLAYLYDEGPILTIELGGVVWPKSPDGGIAGSK